MSQMLSMVYLPSEVLTFLAISFSEEVWFLRTMLTCSGSELSEAIQVSVSIASPVGVGPTEYIRDSSPFDGVRLAEVNLVPVLGGSDGDS